MKTRKQRVLASCMAVFAYIAPAMPALAFPADSPGAEAAVDAVLTVYVLCTEEGRLRVDLVDEATFGVPDRPLLRREVLIGQDDLSWPVSVSFHCLKAGRYAIRAFIDRNGDGRLNAGIFGPTEPWALSWATAPKRGIPSFDDEAFRVENGMNNITMETKK